MKGLLRKVTERVLSDAARHSKGSFGVSTEGLGEPAKARFYRENFEDLMGGGPRPRIDATRPASHCPGSGSVPDEGRSLLPKLASGPAASTAPLGPLQAQLQEEEGPEEVREEVDEVHVPE